MEGTSGNKWYDEVKAQMKKKKPKDKETEKEEKIKGR